MSRMKGPAIFLAQFAGQEAPFDTLANITRWAGDLGYKGVQIPTWEAADRPGKGGTQQGLL